MHVHLDVARLLSLGAQVEQCARLRHTHATSRPAAPTPTPAPAAAAPAATVSAGKERGTVGLLLRDRLSRLCDALPLDLRLLLLQPRLFIARELVRRWRQRHVRLDRAPDQAAALLLDGNELDPTHLLHVARARRRPARAAPAARGAAAPSSLLHLPCTSRPERIGPASGPVSAALHGTAPRL